MMFTVLDDIVILRSSRGVYTQTQLAVRGQHVYACVGKSFIMLYDKGVTSSPHMKWEDMQARTKYGVGQFGRLITA